jgi:integrase
MKTDYLLHREAERVLCALTPVNRRIMKVCMHTGLRLGDVLALTTDQIKPVTSVLERKTGKLRRIGFPEILRDEILDAVKINSKGPAFAFPGRKPGTHQTRQAVWKDVKRAAKAFRMNQNVAPHSFRKLYAVDLLAKYGDVKRVQRALSHSSQTVTMIYAMADKLLQDKKKK